MAKKAAQSGDLDASMRIVVLYGKERFIIEEHTRRFAGLLEEKFGGLEQFHFDGERVQPAEVLDELRSYGLMQRHKLVILDHAETFLAGRKGEEEDEDGEGAAASAASSRRPLFERYAENPVADATLLLRAETWRAGKLDKLIAKVGCIIECKTPDERTAASWCIKRCEKRHNAILNPDAAQLLVARLGAELQRLDTEMAKLATMAGSGGTITRDLVAQAVELSREEKAWEIQSAIVTGNASIMLRKLRELLEVSRHDVVPISWAVCDLLRKLHAASQLLRRRVPRQGVMGQLKLWGSTVDPILRIAEQLEPRTLAQLLRHAIETDAGTKSGVGDPQRSLEALMVRIADTLQSGASRQHSMT